MKKVILLCQDHLGTSMAGPAIRYWEFAIALSKSYNVVLMCPNVPSISDTRFKVMQYTLKQLRLEMENAHTVISQLVNAPLAFFAKKNKVRIILDAYDPIPLEHFEIFKDHSLQFRESENNKIIDQFNFSFKIVDSVICANTKQKDLWMGMLMSLKRLTPTRYSQDCLLKNLIDIVPFGLSSIPPVKNGPGMRERFGLKSTDKVIVWGGGIWNWFDPLSLIKAVEILSQTRDDIKLVFMGLKHPNESIPEMKMALDAVNLAKEKNLYDKHVFFNFSWVPYNERQNFLLEADVGASIHLQHLETHYSFRTRILDYLWAELPILTTEGDSFAEVVAQRQLGAVVPYENAQAIADAIVQLVDHPQAKVKANIREVRDEFYWDKIVQPICRMIDHNNAPLNALSTREWLGLSRWVVKTYGPMRIAKYVLKKIKV